MPALQRKGGRSAGGGHSEDEVVVPTTGPDPFVQNLFVLCHGEQVLSNSNVDVDDTATTTAKTKTKKKSLSARAMRAWEDPPLTARGKLQAWRVGRQILLDDWNVTRVVVSPLLRCVQTAVEVIAALSMQLPSSTAASTHLQAHQQPQASSYGGVSSRSHIKVSIESGLVDNLEELYSMLPTAMRDPGFQLTKHKQSESTAEDGGYRYTSTLKKITNASPHENILCITYGEGMRMAMSMMWPPMEMHEVTHCAYSHAQRAIFEDKDDDSCFLSSDWELLTESGSSSGLFFTRMYCT